MFSQVRNQIFRCIPKQSWHVHINISSKSIDRSRFPILDENDLEEKFIKGSGPGGQKVNKSVNCCYLRHKPTGLSVKVHEDRSLIKNRQIARKHLLVKLDNLLNGEDSVQKQKERIELENLARTKASRKKVREMKLQAKMAIQQSDEHESDIDVYK